MSAEALFDGFDDPIVPEADTRTAGERRKTRQAVAITKGYHPLSLVIAGIRLHPEARLDVPPGTRSEPFTCGTCIHRVNRHGGAKSYPKCDLPKRDTASEATDVRASWPACVDYERTMP